MIEPVTKSRWEDAQIAEIAATTYHPERSRQSYEHIFNYLGMSFSETGGFIAEIGCGAYPAISFCPNASGVVYEPLWFDSLHELASKERIVWYQRAFEDMPHPPPAAEAWLFNCLQHVRDPELVISMCKEIADVIRFFEPVDYPTCVYHPHTFTQDDFVRWFGDVKRYTDRLPGFFDADCCYGTWNA